MVSIFLHYQIPNQIQYKKAPSGKAYIEIAKRVLGEKIEVTIPGREKGFFAKLKRLFKRD